MFCFFYFVSFSLHYVFIYYVWLLLPTKVKFTSLVSGLQATEKCQSVLYKLTGGVVTNSSKVNASQPLRMIVFAVDGNNLP